MRRSKKRIYGEYLVLAAQSGDRRALERLVALWQIPLQRHARHLLNDADQARDALQDAWLDIVRGVSGLKQSAAFPAWAHRIVTRKCAAIIRSRQKQRRVLDELAHQPADHPDPLTELDDRAQLRPVVAALQALPPDQRSAMALFYLEDMTVAEIAIAVDVPAGTVKTRLMHARRKVRTAVETPADGDDHDAETG